MKRLLLLPLLMISCLCFAQDAKEIIGKPIKIGGLLVAENDITYVKYWEDGVEACRDLGKGWRLPTNTELRILYLNRKKIKGFLGVNYWSSSKSKYGRYYYLDFNDGKLKEISVNEEFTDDIPHVRAVKSL
jgi:hypothetical protein